MKSVHVKNPFSIKETGKGLGLAVSLNVLNYLGSGLLFLFSLGSCGPYGILGDISCILLPFWGLTQLVYLGPMIWLARRKEKRDFALGLMIGMGITLIANGGTYYFSDQAISILAKGVDRISYLFGFRK